MKTNMEDIDKLIKETLSQEEAKFYDELDEQNLFNMVLSVFSGKKKWMFVLINFIQLLLFAAFVYCAIQFFKVEETNELIKWGFGGLITLFGTSMLKMFTWMEMDTKAILRETKRLELLVSSMAGKMSS